MEIDTSKIQYVFKSEGTEFVCRATVTIGKEVFDLYGKGPSRQDARTVAQRNLIAMTKLLFPTVPMALFNGSPVLQSKYTLVHSFSLKCEYTVIHPYEIKTGRLFIYINVRLKNYVVLMDKRSQDDKVLRPSCPIELLNDPVRFTDWSQGPVCPAQENYLSQRVEWCVSSL